jgi:hypothetical protein
MLVDLVVMWPNWGVEYVLEDTTWKHEEVILTSPFLIPGLVMYNINMMYGRGTNNVICNFLYIINNKENLSPNLVEHGKRHGD